jgi:hypothetical protein
MSSRLAKKIWKCNIPLKKRIFMWQTFQNRLQTSQQLKHMKWKGSELCSLCGEEEDVDHLLFSCPLVMFVWEFVREALGWHDYPRNL